MRVRAIGRKRHRRKGRILLDQSEATGRLQVPQLDGVAPRLICAYKRRQTVVGEKTRFLFWFDEPPMFLNGRKRPERSWRFPCFALSKPAFSRSRRAHPAFDHRMTERTRVEKLEFLTPNIRIIVFEMNH